MKRRAYFSFHYAADIARANVVRNSWVTRGREASEFIDGSLWEETKTKGDAAIKALIRRSLRNTSVTPVLIGEHTASRRAVHYEIEQSLLRGNGILGIRIHQIKDLQRKTSAPGANPLNQHFVRGDNGSVRLSSVVPTYDWVADDGYRNIGKWIDDAAISARRPNVSHRTGSINASAPRSDNSAWFGVGLALALVAGWAIIRDRKPPDASHTW